MMFLRIDFDVEKNNLVVGVYGVLGLVSYRNNDIGVAFFMSLLLSLIDIALATSPHVPGFR